MRACPTKALGLQDGKAVVVDPLVCEYSGLCEAVCPTQAISRPFEIVVACIANEEGKAFLNSTNVIEKEPTSAYNAD
jgi:ferredoxin